MGIAATEVTEHHGIIHTSDCRRVMVVQYPGIYGRAIVSDEAIEPDDPEYVEATQYVEGMRFMYAFRDERTDMIVENFV